jgi:hypothetical protein
MSTSQCATDPELADPSLIQSAALVQSASGDSPRRPKGVLIGFAATVTIGLALASWYVGVRIMDANEITPVSAASPRAPAAAATREDAKVATPQVAPSPPDLYLQVAGLGPRQDTSFVKRLEAKGYQARIIGGTAEGAASQEDRRILIGPFAGRSFLEEAERNLQSAGVLATEVTY